MALKHFYKKYENRIIAVALVLFLGVIIGIRYDYYYDLNDDVTMKDIMSGVYTGEPEGHNIQMLYPLSLFISLLYRILPNAPVYGAVLCLCQYGCIWLIVNRSLAFKNNTPAKWFLAGVEGIVIFVLCLEHLVFVQYTVTCSLLAATAAFLFITTKPGLSAGQFIRKNVPSILLALLSYLFRTEMMLLLLPLICVAGVYRWSMEKEVFTKENFRKYLTVIGAILVGMLAATVINHMAFGSVEWKRYVDFFNSRTELYDFQGIPAYEGNEELYESLKMTKSEQYMLLDQYNFGLDDTLDAAALDAISEYQAEHKKEARQWMTLLKEKLRLYVYRTLHKEPADSAVLDDYPWNLMVILGYLAVFVSMLWKNKRNFIGSAWKLCFLFIVRTALWMFILVRERDPVRITHSLYLMEFCILMSMLQVECAGLGMKTGVPVKRAIVFPAVIVLAAAVSLPDGIGSVDKEYDARTVASAVDKGMKEYCRGHEDNFYFMDVYSAVSYPLEPYMSTYYSEKMFCDVDNHVGNYDIMGGWLVKSPLTTKKLNHFQMDSMQEGMLYNENVYMMAELSKGTDHIRSYFEEQLEDQDIQVQVDLTDTICDIIGVYKIEVTGEKVE